MKHQFIKHNSQAEPPSSSVSHLPQLLWVNTLVGQELFPYVSVSSLGTTWSEYVFCVFTNSVDSFPSPTWARVYFYQLKHPLSSSSQLTDLQWGEVPSVFMFGSYCFLPLPSLCAGRSSEPSNPPYPLCISHDFVAFLLHAPSVISFPDRRAWCTQLFPRQKTFHTCWIIPAAFLSNIFKFTESFAHGKREDVL